LRTRRLFLLSTLTVSIMSLMKMQPGLGEPSEALQTVTILSFFHLAFLSFVGVFLAAGNDKISDNVPDIFKTPLPYIMAVGLLFSMTGVALPYDVLDFIDTFHNIVFPIALLTLGLMVGKYIYFFQFAEYSVLLPPLILCTFFKLIFSPALAMLIITLMGIDDVALQRALIITSGAPTGIFAAIIVSVYGRPNERRFVVLCILVTVLLSFLTLPVLHFFVDKFFPVAVLTP
jgi:malate permease and related proteins